MERICKIEGCGKIIKGHSARGLCKNHYRKFLLYGEAEAFDRRKMRARNTCKIDGCERLCNSHGLCRPHYMRLQKYGDPLKRHRKYQSKHNAEQKTWYSMCDRCNNPDCHAYPNYGGRGIKVCDRWNCGIDGFYNFLEDMGSRPKGTTLDRIDVNGDYCPENCRWADNIVQQNNRRDNRLMTIRGETKTVTQWAREYGISVPTVFSRIRKGETGERIFRKPWTDRI